MSASAHASTKLTGDRDWPSRSILFQNLVAPSMFDSEQIFFVEAQSFVHPSGNRNTLEISATKPPFPVGVTVRVHRLPVQSIKDETALEVGTFWYGHNSNFFGQVGVSFLQEGIQDLEGRQYIIPHMTIRTLYTRGHLESIQSISVPISLSRGEPHRIHTNHTVSYLLPWKANLFVSIGGSFDILAILQKEEQQLYFTDSEAVEYEQFQFLLGPVISIMHQKYGKLTLRVEENMMISSDYGSPRRYFIRFFEWPAIGVNYALGF